MSQTVIHGSLKATPHQHPQGMGVAGLLESELFGLRSTVDSETLRRMDRRNYLFSTVERRSRAEYEGLKHLSDVLSDLGFASDFKDPYYAMFVRKMVAQHTKFHKETLTPEERKEQDAIADVIIDEILGEKRLDDPKLINRIYLIH